MVYNPLEDNDTDVLEADIETEKEKSHSIVLYNDDYNTFQHVIMCLMKYCEHNPHQAEQCAIIIDANGKCSVKEGDYKKLKPIKEALCEQGLDAKIE